jgi:hypothetical protein
MSRSKKVVVFRSAKVGRPGRGGRWCAEFTALLDEEWEKLSSEQKKEATKKAVELKGKKAMEMAFSELLTELLRHPARLLPRWGPGDS